MSHDRRVSDHHGPGKRRDLRRARLRRISRLKQSRAPKPAAAGVGLRHHMSRRDGSRGEPAAIIHPDRSLPEFGGRLHRTCNDPEGRARLTFGAGHPALNRHSGGFLP